MVFMVTNSGVLRVLVLSVRFVVEIVVLAFSRFLPPDGLSALNPQLRREPHVPVVFGMVHWLCSGSTLLRTNLQCCLIVASEK